MKLIIVGGVAGGASAAARARRLSEHAEIILFERGPDVSFANCGLPYYIGDTIQEREKLLVAKPVQLSGRYRLDVRTRTEVLSIDRAAKTVRVRNLSNDSTYDESYDQLILAPGAAPLRPPVPGIDLPGVYTLRNLQDVDKIRGEIDKGIKRAVIVGAGFIGLELAENLVHRGVETTLVELADQVLPPMDREMTAPVVARLKAHGVQVRLGDSAEAFEHVEAGGHLVVRLKSGGLICTDLVLLGVGVRPENTLAAGAGLAIGARGGIHVDDRMRTSDPYIFAVGDAVEIKGFVSGAPAQVPLAGPANRQGRIAADNVFGKESHYRGTQGTAILGLFGFTVAMTGETEKSLKRAGRSYQKVYIHPSHHASYYPGAKVMSLKLVFDPQDGRILGAQGVGEAGVDKRIDALSMAIQGKLTVFDLEEAELAYAPQFGSAKDPINMLGFVAAHVVRGDYPQVQVDELPSTVDALLLDVRTAQEFSQGAIPGARNVPLEDMRERLNELPRNQRIIAYCQVGQRGYAATLLLKQKGFDAANLAGGYSTYRLFHPV